jgi:NADH:ubiquinone oxidoreductase subunit E
VDLGLFDFYKTFHHHPVHYARIELEHSISCRYQGLESLLTNVELHIDFLGGNSIRDRKREFSERSILTIALARGSNMLDS